MASNVINNSPGPLTHLQSFVEHQKASPRTSITQEKGPVTHGSGALEGRQIAVGDGQQNNSGRSVLNALKTGALRLGQGLLLVVSLPLSISSSIGLGLAALGKYVGEKLTGVTIEARNQAREARAEARYIQASHDMIEALKAPQDDLYLGGKQDIMDRLMAHSQMTGKTMSMAEIRDLVISGENIARALQAPENSTGRSPLSISIYGQEHQVPSNSYTVRALSWFMMASAASQDIGRNLAGDTSSSDMTTSGAFIMKDPGNRIYNFLNDAPGSTARMSTHFEERLGHDKEHYMLGFVPTFGKKSAQRGIEDFQSRMPGQGGAMLFDKLKPDANGQEELFVKFEAAGCPPYFNAESHHSIGDKFLRFFASLDRNIHHCINFKKSQNQQGSAEAAKVSRQEHMHKGVLQPCFDAVRDLFRHAQDAGLVQRDDASGVARSMKKFGVGAGLVVAQEIRARANAQGDNMLEARAASVAGLIQDEIRRLDIASADLNIERRGAEVHISIDPATIQERSRRHEPGTGTGPDHAQGPVN